ncbi:hypothetical protein T265_09644 [Opisthorchis viverrini]|uniref:Uncharacterized protein n=1 Tax=Opisthorchis viverrini TaxID=6198 RepID=A0A074Z580_OPIVI|nr:hypothetical protein T265_09644 [Opisthorchis viverrini]KER22223.1 hypothetical protein T265_09644 [Opisthorchis viverrini]
MQNTRVPLSADELNGLFQFPLDEELGDGDGNERIAQYQHVINAQFVDADVLALMHPSHCLQCIAPFPIPPLNSSHTVLYLCTNLSAPASNAQLPTPPPRIINERNCGSLNHCTTTTWLLQLTMMMC